MSNINLQIVTSGYASRNKVAQLPKQLLHQKNAVKWLLNFKRVKLPTFPSREIRAETAMNLDTAQPVRTFHAVRSKQMSERQHKGTQGQNLTTETPKDLERKEPGSICYPGEKFKTQRISLASKPPGNKTVAQFSEADPEIATLDLVQSDLETEAGQEVPKAFRYWALSTTWCKRHWLVSKRTDACAPIIR